MKTCYTFLFCGMLIVCLGSTQTIASNMEPPNIVLIMCDDMGFSDLGCYGGEIKTPHIDALAYEGVRFGQFKNTGRCCPSRASLMTGRHPHAVDMGWMTKIDEHRPGYRGQITDRVPTLAEILRDNGYGTYMSGKWHLTVDGAWALRDSKPNGSWPTQRGFQQYYGSLSGGGGYYRVNGLARNETRISTFPDDYYYTTAITENAVNFIEGHDTQKPLFLYLAHYAPHRPLEAPKARVDACRKRYRVGYDVLRAARHKRLQKVGLIASHAELPVHLREYKNSRPAWNSLSGEKKEAWITEMATYAAMIEIMDDGIGQVVEATRKKGIFENTVFLFLSDNGATYEGGLISQLGADLSNTPYRYYKQFTYMGGISSPLIVRLPQRFPAIKGEIRNEVAHITDILPTCLDLAGVAYPGLFKGKSIPAPDGLSLVPVVNNNKLPERDFYFEHQTSCAIISGNWKLVRAHQSKPWELINLNDDPFEQNDAAKDYPEKVKELETKWEAWAQANHVFPLESRPWTPRFKHYQKLYPDQDGLD